MSKVEFGEAAKCQSESLTGPGSKLWVITVLSLMAVTLTMPVMGPQQAGHVDLDVGNALLQVREDLDIVHPDRAACGQLQSPDKAVPVGLGMVRDAVGIDAHIHDHAVVDTYGQPMAARREVDPSS